jgi:hypothetical protein
MASWGTMTMCLNPIDEVLAFVAHHLSVGSERIYLFFDDPNDPAADVVADIDRVRVILCDDAHWSRKGGKRPALHQERQRQNALRVYQATKLPWIAHIDVDEFLLSDRPIGNLLDDIPNDQIVVQVPPFEALYQPEAENGTFSARQFRGRIQDRDLAEQIFGDLHPILSAGMLSHKQGKAFFRTGVAGLMPLVHHAKIGTYITYDAAFHSEIKLLHFHADNPDSWVAAAHYRASKGAYKFQKELSTHLLSLGKDELYEFHRLIHQMTPDKLDLLRNAGVLVEVDLHLRDRLAALTAAQN